MKTPPSSINPPPTDPSDPTEGISADPEQDDLHETPGQKFWNWPKAILGAVVEGLPNW